MKRIQATPLMKALLVAVIMAVIGWIGLDVPRSAVEETIEQQFDAWEQSKETQTETGGEYVGLVTNVIDGDTVDVVIDDEEIRLRLIGIDTPETKFAPGGAECYADEATERARQLLAGQTVTIRTDSSQGDRDVHGRLLSYVTVSDGRDFGQILIREGFAKEYTYDNPYQNQADYQAAQAQAQADNVGLWDACE